VSNEFGKKTKRLDGLWINKNESAKIMDKWWREMEWST
jgi:hypothetical protein